MKGFTEGDESPESKLLRQGWEQFPDPMEDPVVLDKAVRRVLKKTRRLSRYLRARRRRATTGSGMMAIIARLLYPAIAAGVVVAFLTPAPSSDQGHHGPPGSALELVQGLSDLEIAWLWDVIESETSNPAPSKDQKSYRDASKAVREYYAQRLRRLRIAANRGGAGLSTEVARYDDASLRLAARLSSRHLATDEDTSRPVLLVNGVDDSQAESYLYAQGAIDWIGRAVPFRVRGNLDAATREALLKWASDRHDRPWPESLSAKLTEAVGVGDIPPAVIVVSSRFDSPDRSRGTLQAVELDPSRGGRHAVVEAEEFVEPHPPVDLFGSYRNLEKPDNVTHSGNSNLLNLVFEHGGQPLSIVALTTTDAGLAIRDFSTGGLAEVVFEAKAEFSGEGKPPTVQFGTGGDELIASVTPPLDLGPGWRPITIPVRLDGAEHWKTGLTVIAHAIPEHTRLTVSIRNPLIRPLGDERSPTGAKPKLGKRVTQMDLGPIYSSTTKLVSNEE
jgi:hypothetical protein